MASDEYQHVTLPYGVLPTDVVNLGTVLGPFFLAHLFNYALYGILILQVYIYWLRFPKDLTYIKTLVYGTFLLDTFFIACITHAAYTVLVTRWGDVNIFHELPWTWATLPISSGLISMIVQLFFVWRIWKLSKQYIMPIIIIIFTVGQCAFAVATSVIAGEVRTFRYIRDLIPGFWLGGSIIADVLTCATLVRILWKSQTGFKDTDGVVMRLIRLSIEAAAVPVVAASIKLGLIYSFHDNRHLVFCVVLARLYSNCLMATLNCRDPLFGGGARPNTLAGAARLSDGPVTLFGFLKSKVTSSFSGTNTRGTSTTASSNPFSSKHGATSSNEKVFVHKSVTSTIENSVDIELEKGLRHDLSHGNARGGDRESSYTLDSFSPRDQYEDSTLDSPLTPYPPSSPGTHAATWPGPVSPDARGTFESKSQLVHAQPGSDGRRVQVQTPIQLPFGARAATPSPTTSAADSPFFPGRS